MWNLIFFFFFRFNKLGIKSRYSTTSISKEFGSLSNVKCIIELGVKTFIAD